MFSKLKMATRPAMPVAATDGARGAVEPACAAIEAMKQPAPDLLRPIGRFRLAGARA